MTSIRITVKNPLRTMRKLDILASVIRGLDIAQAEKKTDLSSLADLSNSIADAIQDRLESTTKPRKVKVPKDELDSNST